MLLESDFAGGKDPNGKMLGAETRRLQFHGSAARISSDPDSVAFPSSEPHVEENGSSPDSPRYEIHSNYNSARSAGTDEPVRYTIPLPLGVECEMRLRTGYYLRGGIGPSSTDGRLPIGSNLDPPLFFR